MKLIELTCQCWSQHLTAHVTIAVPVCLLLPPDGEKERVYPSQTNLHGLPRKPKSQTQCKQGPNLKTVQGRVWCRRLGGKRIYNK